MKKTTTANKSYEESFFQAFSRREGNGLWNVSRLFRRMDSENWGGKWHSLLVSCRRSIRKIGLRLKKEEVAFLINIWKVSL